MRLSRHEQEELQHVLRVLLTAGNHDTFDDWRDAVNAAMKPLLGADLAAFVCFTDEAAHMHSSDIARIDEYVPLTAAMDARIGLWERQRQQVVWNRRSLWGTHLEEMRRSEYYHDFIRPIRAFDTIGLTVELPASRRLASLHLCHDTEKGTRFGQRGIALLNLIAPVFRAGIGGALAHFFPESHGAPRFRRGDARHVIAASEAGSRLTRREREVVTLLARRRSNREIADGLGMSPSTAKRHTENVLRKLGLTSRHDVERVIGDD